MVTQNLKKFDTPVFPFTAIVGQEEMKLALVVVTHDLTFATRFPKVYRMKDGLWL